MGNRKGTGGRARKRASRLPADWQPSESDIDFALKEGFDGGHIQLAAVVRIPEMAAIETMTGIMIEELSDVSPEVLEHTFRHWIRTQKFFPTIAELIEITEPLMATLRHEQYELEVLASVTANPAPDLWVTGDWLDARASDAHAAAYPPAVKDKLNSRRLIERRKY